MKKIIITGSKGLLGSAFACMEFGGQKILCPSDTLDVTDFVAVKELITREKPDIILHCAAHTDVEKSETDKGVAYRVNAMGTANLANAALYLDKEPTFCFISSVGVYGAHKSEPYTEFDVATPTTVHHSSKFEAEKIVISHIKKHLIIRTGWLFGGDATQPKNFVYKRYVEACGIGVMRANDAQVGNPTFVGDVVSQVASLLEKERFGVYNCVNGGIATRYEYIKKIIELFEIDCAVEAARDGEFKRIAPVSPNESAINFKLDLMGLNIMPNWEESLAKYIDKLKKELL